MLILSLPPQQELTIQKIPMITPEIAKEYADFSEKTIKRDIDELIKMELLIKIKDKYKINTKLLKSYTVQQKINNRTSK